ncbi:jacalin-like lectin [Synechococcus sp. CCY 9618]|uniref:jacalin-like lectin n=1 Tax=Synechococcus sp. CCY 9618 TaxID=2815602 RepID=UPI001C233519|nr:hypothetical protein [Synechococcus sp. CCY 9618]
MADPSELAQQVARGALFRGRHCVTGGGEPLEAAVSGTVLPAGGGSTMGWQLCRSRQELVRSLHSSGSLGIGLGPLNLLNAKQAFRDSLKTTSFSLSLVVWARQVATALEVGQSHLLEGVAVPASAAELEAFVALYGDGFVAAAEVGGECHGVFTFYAQSREQARMVEREFEAGLGLGGLALTPALVETVTTVARRAEVNVGFRMQVSGSRAQPPAEAASLIPFARDFAGLRLDHPALIGVRTRGYESVPAIGGAFQLVATNRQLFSGEGPGEGFSERRERLEGLIRQMDWVDDTYRLYAVPPDPSLAVQRAAARADLGAIDACLGAYAAAPTAPLEPPPLPSLAAGSPELNVTLGEEVPMGGNGGTPFAFPGRAEAIRQRRHLVEVALRTGSRVDQIRLRYAGEGDPLEAEVHGGGGGGDRGRLELGEGVVIRRIEALSGTRVDRLFLTSSDGQRIGGGGDAGDRPLDWTVPADSVVLGFSGRCGRELDGLRAMVARFGPLIWQPLEVAAEGP